MTADTLWKDLIHIPETVHRAEFVVDLAGGIDRPDEIVESYVITPNLVEAFREGLELVDRAVRTGKSVASFLHGSFGSGKSHYMAMLYLLLKGHEGARARPELARVVADFDHLSQKNFLLVPYHMVGKESMEHGVFEGYVRAVRQHRPQAPLPGLYAAEGLFENARKLRARMGDEAFFALLNDGAEEGADADWGTLHTAWDAASLERVMASTPGGDDDAERDRLVGDLVERIFPALGESGLAKFVDLDRGLEILSRHAKGLGYDGVVLFLDEIILWLASRAGSADFLNREAPKLSKLVEAQHANRPAPLISFMARQRDLTEFVGEGTLGSEFAALEQALEFWKGRFGEIRLSDMDLPDIVHQRVLRRRSPEADERIREGFERFMGRLRSDEKDILQTADFDSDMFARVFPFSPALIKALIALSSTLQRERTALRLLTQLLHRHRHELTLDRVVPVGDLWEVVGEGEEPFSATLKAQFRAARRLWTERLQPTLHAQHRITVDEARALRQRDPETLTGEEQLKLRVLRNDERIAWTLLIAALVPGVDVLRDLNVRRIAALNHGAVHAPLRGQESRQVAQTLKRWASEVSEIDLDHAADPRVRLNLSDVDVDALISFAATHDNLTNRQKLVRQELAAALQLGESDDTWHVHTTDWRGGRRELRIRFANVRTLRDAELAGEQDRWTLLIDYPFDEGDHSTRDDTGKLDNYREQHGAKALTVAWLPHFLTPEGRRLMGRLVQVNWTLQRFEDAAAALPPADRPVAKAQLESHRETLRRQVSAMLRRAYHLSAEQLETVETEESGPGLHSLHAALVPRMPGTVAFNEGLERIAHDMMSALYPAAPALPDRNITRGQADKLCAVLVEAFESAEASHDVLDRGVRELAREIVPPLRLGELGESRLARSDEHLNEITRATQQREKGTPLTVGHLRRMLDPDDARTGLPTVLQDLLILTWAARTNHALTHGEIPVDEPAVGKLNDAMVLAPAALPGEEAWAALERLCGEIFGLTRPKVRNARTVQRLASEIGAKVQAKRRSLEGLPAALEAAATRIGMDTRALRTSDRWKALASARALLKTLGRAEDNRALLEGIASHGFAPSSTAVGGTLGSAEDTLAALQADQWVGLEVLAKQGEDAHPALRKAQRFLRTAPYAAEGKVPALREAQAEGTDALRRASLAGGPLTAAASTAPATAAVPPSAEAAAHEAPVGAAAPASTTVSTGAPAGAAAGARRARVDTAAALDALLSELRRALDAGRAVEVVWTEEEP
ncbi:MAG: hypothetical protein EA398_15790 [Deltaproteobacteria bacterium]|nr:MAG: hypothetical protein EA398_15790 [Deltaproteobacteria bacterium]